MIKYEMIPMVDVNDVIDEIQKVYNVDVTSAMIDFFMDTEVPSYLYDFRFPAQEVIEDDDEAWQIRVRLCNMMDELFQKQFDENVCYVELNWEGR